MQKHDEHEHHGGIQGKFRFAVICTGVVLIFEIVGGLLTNSLALISDAAHVFADVFSLVLSWVAIYLATLPATNRKTYGYHRAEVFAAFINGVSLIAIAGYIFYEAFNRFVRPEPIKSIQMLIVAFVGLCANLIVVWIFRRESHENLNVKSAFLHVLGDALSSVAVIIGGIVMSLTGEYIYDAILSVLIGFVILIGAWRVVAESTHILFEGAPKNVSAKDVAFHLRSMDFVKNVHDMHIWAVCSNFNALSAHVLIDEQSTLSMSCLLAKINQALREKFGITHTTIQLESVENQDDTLLCNAKHDN